MPWRREWQPTPVFLPGESHGQRSLAGYSPWDCERVGHDWVTNIFSGSPVVKTWPSNAGMQGLQVQSLVRELRSHIPCGQKTKTKKRFLESESRHHFSKALWVIWNVQPRWRSKFSKGKQRTADWSVTTPPFMWLVILISEVLDVWCWCWEGWGAVLLDQRSRWAGCLP